MADNQNEEQAQTAKEELESEWSGSVVAFIGVGLGASIVLTTLIILALLWWAMVHDNLQILEAIFNLVG